MSCINRHRNVSGGFRRWPLIGGAVAGVGDQAVWRGELERPRSCPRSGPALRDCCDNGPVSFCCVFRLAVSVKVLVSVPLRCFTNKVSLPLDFPSPLANLPHSLAAFLSVAATSHYLSILTSRERRDAQQAANQQASVVR